jgi:hypothetical protein
MKYLIMIHHNQKALETWGAMSEAERAEGMQAYAAFHADLVKSGELVANEALADPSQGVRVTVQDGETTTADGPFAEAKEHLAGIYIVDVKGRERAVELAARIPEAALGLVEVRPVNSLDGM